MKFTEFESWDFVKVYKDKGYTGRITDLPAFQKILAGRLQKP
jgi:hypothetical protein